MLVALLVVALAGCSDGHPNTRAQRDAEQGCVVAIRSRGPGLPFLLSAMPLFRQAARLDRSHFQNLLEAADQQLRTMQTGFHTRDDFGQQQRFFSACKPWLGSYDRRPPAN